MIWDDHIVLADGLAKFGLEVTDRTAVSRAYYGAFNLSRRWLEENVTPIENGRAHKLVWETFRAADHASARSRDDWVLVGNLGGSLRGLRNQVDYSDLAQDLDGRVGGALRDAERIVALLPALELAD